MLLSDSTHTALNRVSSVKDKKDTFRLGILKIYRNSRRDSRCYSKHGPYPNPTQPIKEGRARYLPQRSESQTLHCRSQSMPNRAVYVKKPKRRFYVTAETITVDAINVHHRSISSRPIENVHRASYNELSQMLSLSRTGMLSKQYQLLTQKAVGTEQASSGS